MQKIVPVLFLLIASAARADILVNGNFENEPNFITQSNSGNANGAITGDGGFELMTANSIPGWTIAAGHGATIHIEQASYAYDYYSVIDGTYSLNTDGEGYNSSNALIYQDFASASGTAYILNFKWGIWNYNGQGPAALEVKLFDTVSNAVLFDGIYQDNSSNPNDPKYPSTLTSTPVTATFLGTGHPLQLQIDENPASGYNDNQFIVDDFSVNAVPEPSTLALAGIVSLLLLRRRK
jgi:PEP-CTERM motif